MTYKLLPTIGSYDVCTWALYQRAQFLGIRYWKYIREIDGMHVEAVKRHLSSDSVIITSAQPTKETP